MKIQMKDWKVRSLSLQFLEKPQKKNSFGLSLANSYSEDNDKEFLTGFLVVINNTEFKIKLEMAFIFELDVPIDDKFKKSDFVKINAPAIAFPYVRSYISNLTLQSGFSPVILPSVNFVQLAQNKMAKKESK